MENKYRPVGRFLKSFFSSATSLLTAILVRFEITSTLIPAFFRAALSSEPTRMLTALRDPCRYRAHFAVGFRRKPLAPTLLPTKTACHGKIRACLAWTAAPNARGMPERR